jgi:hypothetical protein
MGSSSITAPASRSYLGEMKSALNAQSGIQDQLLGLERQYTPLWQEQQQSSLMGGLNSMNALYNSAIPMSGQLGLQTANAMSPAYAQAGRSAMSAYQGMFSPEAQNVYGLMGQQAQQGLQAGYGLNEQQTQYSQQSARAAMAARGMNTGNQAIAQEVLGSYQLGNQRYQQNLLNAQNYLGTSQNIASQAYTMYGQPMLNQINQTSPASLLQGSSGFNAGLGAKLFNPESQYNADLIGANQANQMSAQLANQQANSGIVSGLMGIAGAGLGGYLQGVGGRPTMPPAAGGGGGGGGAPSTAGTYSAGYGMPPYRNS